MPLKSLKMSRKERDARSKELMEAPMDDTYYPYGTRLHLDDETVAKLGLPNMRAGETVNITATAKVSSVSSHENEKDKNPRLSMDFQITDMSVEKPSSAKEKASKLYPSSEA